jgi:WS/DGAT/MGAT family acyltransferase
MATLAYERLSAQDRTFLDLEAPNHPQHIAAVSLFEAAPLRSASGGVDIERVRAHVASRLHRLPRYRQRLGWIPLENHPVWVDDAHFQIAFHVRHTGLPRPGDAKQLKRLVGRILAQPLDREKPLWEMWVVEGLVGDRVALVAKTHHCMIDGLSGVDLMATLMSHAPVDTPEEAPPWQPRPSPDGVAMLAREIGRRAGTWTEALARLPAALRQPEELAERVRESVAAVGQALGSSLRPASELPINRPLGPHRAFEWCEIPLERVKAVKKALGGTVNDVVLASVAGALRRFLERRSIAPEGLLVRANVPVSLRNHDERGTLGNRIALLVAELPVGERDPVLRLVRVRDEMERLKGSRRTLGAEVLAAVSEWTSATLLSLAVRVATRGRPYNLVVTNVPGPQVPLYLLGGRMTAVYPVVNLLRAQGLGIALFSYDGLLCWGFVADPEQVPDLPELARALLASFEELEAAAHRAREGGR